MVDEWATGEIIRTIQRLEDVVEEHKKDHRTLNRTLLVVTLTALANFMAVVGGALIHK